MFKYCWSHRGEDYQEFDCDTTEDNLEEAIQHTLEDYDHDEIWVGTVNPITIDNILCSMGEEIIERIQEIAYDNYGEVTEDFLATTREQENDLSVRISKVIKAWITENKLEPNFFTVTDPVKYERLKCDNLL